MGSENNKTARERNGAFDLLRIIACCGILYLHYRSYISPGGVFWGGTLVTADNSGVDLRCFVEVFFVLSGYLMYLYVERIRNGMSFGDYYCPRLWRIIPLLAAGTVVYQLLSYSLLRMGQDVSYAQSSLWGILSSALGVQEGWSFVNSYINPEAWFLDVLLLCYLLTYIIVNICKKAGADSCWGFAFMILLGAGCVSRESTFPFLGYMAGRGYEAYFGGMFLAAVLKKRNGGKFRYIAAAIVLVVYTIYHVFAPWLLNYGKFYLVAFFVAPSLVILADTPFARKIFAWKGFTYIGKVTFATYVFHTCTLLGIRNIMVCLGLSVDYGHEVMLLAYMFCAFAVGSLAYLLIERPLNSLKNKINRKKSE